MKFPLGMSNTTCSIPLSRSIRNLNTKIICYFIIYFPFSLSGGRGIHFKQKPESTRYVASHTCDDTPPSCRVLRFLTRVIPVRTTRSRFTQSSHRIRGRPILFVSTMLMTFAHPTTFLQHVQSTLVVSVTISAPPFSPQVCRPLSINLATHSFVTQFFSQAYIFVLLLVNANVLSPYDSATTIHYLSLYLFIFIFRPSGSPFTFLHATAADWILRRTSTSLHLQRPSHQDI